MNDHSNWLATFKELVTHVLPAIERTPSLYAGCAVALAVGLVMAFRGGKLLRWMVTGLGLLIGTWVGVEIAQYVGTPAPITAALCAVVLSVMCYRTYKLWLVFGSIVTLVVFALSYQLGQGDLTRYIRNPDQAMREQVVVPSRAEQMRNWPDRSEAVRQVRQRVQEELQSFSLKKWILPVIAAVLGSVLAWKALHAFAIIWTGLLGAITAVMGGATLLCAHWTSLRTPMIEHPQVLAGIIAGVWLAGLVVQAREARFPKPPPPGGGDQKPGPKPA